MFTQRADNSVGVGLTLLLVEQGELCIDGGSWEGGQPKQVFLQQGDVGLLVHSRHVLCEGDEEQDPTDLFQFTGKHLRKVKGDEF